MKIPKKVIDRLTANIKTFQAVAQSHRERDVSEADTVTLIKDVMAVCFGYDKYTELTSEQQIKGTYCDLAVKIEGKIKYLIEVKAAGVNLNESHLRQAINYGVTQGIEWIVLTNSIEWRLYRIKFGQPVEHEEISSFSLVNINIRNEEDQKKVFLLCREGLSSDAMDEYHQHMQIFNKFTVAQVIITDPVVSAIRKELKRLFPDVKIDHEHISDILSNDVLKREVIEGDKVKETQQKIKRINAKLEKLSEKKKVQESPEVSTEAIESPSA
ncbi:MAG: type I restriction enzyme HsdR N-terminal domain-containing protein [Pedobacter sp.]|nr:type I restriction enzyme HsdR N-terminal domain-containing protein [Pedobacter sp.]